MTSEVSLSELADKLTQRTLETPEQLLQKINSIETLPLQERALIASRIVGARFEHQRDYAKQIITNFERIFTPDVMKLLGSRYRTIVPTAITQLAVPSPHYDISNIDTIAHGYALLEKLSKPTLDQRFEVDETRFGKVASAYITLMTHCHDDPLTPYTYKGTDERGANLYSHERGALILAKAWRLFLKHVAHVDKIAGNSLIMQQVQKLLDAGKIKGAYNLATRKDLARFEVRAYSIAEKIGGEIRHCIYTKDTKAGMERLHLLLAEPRTTMYLKGSKDIFSENDPTLAGIILYALRLAISGTGRRDIGHFNDLTTGKTGVYLKKICGKKWDAYWDQFIQKESAEIKPTDISSDYYRTLHAFSKTKLGKDRSVKLYDALVESLPRMSHGALEYVAANMKRLSAEPGFGEAVNLRFTELVRAGKLEDAAAFDSILSTYLTTQNKQALQMLVPHRKPIESWETSRNQPHFDNVPEYTGRRSRACEEPL